MQIPRLFATQNESGTVVRSRLRLFPDTEDEQGRADGDFVLCFEGAFTDSDVVYVGSIGASQVLDMEGDAVPLDFAVAAGNQPVLNMNLIGRVSTNGNPVGFDRYFRALQRKRV